MVKIKGSHNNFFVDDDDEYDGDGTEDYVYSSQEDDYEDDKY